MSATPTPDARYPIGRLEAKARPLTPEERSDRVAVLASHPGLLRTLVSELTDKQQDTPYREGGWTVRQLVHHLADSHLNAYTRFRLALTEENPTIRPYDQDAWAELPDAKYGPVDASLGLLDGLHARWVRLLSNMEPGEFGRALRHPEIGDVTLDFMLEMYAWHCTHHEGHVRAARAPQPS